MMDKKLMKIALLLLSLVITIIGFFTYTYKDFNEIFLGKDNNITYKVISEIKGADIDADGLEDSVFLYYENNEVFLMMKNQVQLIGFWITTMMV